MLARHAFDSYSPTVSRLLVDLVTGLRSRISGSIHAGVLTLDKLLHKVQDRQIDNER